MNMFQTISACFSLHFSSLTLKHRLLSCIFGAECNGKVCPNGIGLKTISRRVQIDEMENHFEMLKSMWNKE